METPSHPSHIEGVVVFVEPSKEHRISPFRTGGFVTFRGVLWYPQKTVTKSNSCLNKRQLATVVGFLAGILGVSTARAQSIPSSVSGKWRIVKILPTHNPQCWDEARATTLVGTMMVYQAHAMVWRGGAVPVTDALSRTMTRRRFQEEYHVELPELGIASASVEEIDLQHEDADITGATTEVPGDTILIAGPGRIVVSACGVFYAAVRVTGKTAGGR